MNQNDKFHGTEFDANAQAVSDEELDNVAGGWSGWDENLSRCPFCHRNLVSGTIDGVLYKICPNLQNHFKIKI